MKTTTIVLRAAGVTVLAILSMALVPEDPQPAMSKTVCNDQPAPANCGSCGTAEITYQEIPGIPDGPCNGEVRVQIIIKITCDGNLCQRVFTVCKGDAGDLEFRCEGNTMHLDLQGTGGSGELTWGDMPKQTDGATCSSAELVCGEGSSSGRYCREVAELRVAVPKLSALAMP
jgi:hypothetical protein